MKLGDCRKDFQEDKTQLTGMVVWTDPDYYFSPYYTSPDDQPKQK